MAYHIAFFETEDSLPSGAIFFSVLYDNKIVRTRRSYEISKSGLRNQDIMSHALQDNVQHFVGYLASDAYHNW